jgi:hypothetical protein
MKRAPPLAHLTLTIWVIMSVFAIVKLRMIDASGREHWSVYEPNKHRIDCVSHDAAVELCKQINLEIEKTLNIGGYAE